MTIGDARKRQEEKPSLWNQKKANCPNCHGTGIDPRQSLSNCPACEGEANRPVVGRDGAGRPIYAGQTAPEPRGTGVLSILEAKELDDIGRVIDYILFQVDHYNVVVISSEDKLALIKLANALKWVS
jgi:hypothetical protein